MATPAAFSRLQLAAALLEYDNDLENPDAPYRSAQDSAIFAHLRRNPAALPELVSRRAGKGAALDTRRSRTSKVSIDHLRNPFGADNSSEIDENEGEGLEVDLASWGLDAFIPKDKAKSAQAKGKQPAPAVGSTRSRIPSTNHEPSFTSPRRGLITAKSMSVGGHIEAFKGVEPELERRRSFGSPLDLVGMEPSGFPLRRPPTSPASFVPSHTMVPFPTKSIRSPSPRIEQAYLDPKPDKEDQTYSIASRNATTVLDERREHSELHHRTLSIDTLGGSKPLEDNPFAIHRPSQISRFDPKSISRTRSHSNASMGSRVMLDKEMDTTSIRTGGPYARERHYSTLELLRPKILVMPSPLQPISTNVAPGPILQFRDGFEWSADGPPLPPGARSSRRLSLLSPLEPGGENIPLASNSFTPNPLMDLTLSQKTFRNTLVVAGQPPSTGFANNLPRAVQDGEQAEFDPAAREEVLPVSPNVDPTSSRGSRPAGKLYGKSLIDDLENRKAQMRSKQRVFTGDQRPSMMARDQQRSSTLIDPASLQTRPKTQYMSSYGSQNTQQGLARHPSMTIKPLLTFDGEAEKRPQPSPTANHLPNTRSVFGVDTLWQREMAKLKELQAAEEQEDEDRRKREEEADRKKQEKKQKKKKKKGSQNIGFTGDNDEPYISAEPPILPDIRRASRRVPPKPSDSDFSSESDLEDLPVQIQEKVSNAWHSSDEDTGPRRTTGTGPRYPKQARKAPPLAGEDSEEDLPLAATIHKAAARAAFSSSQRYPLDSDDEDQPLSHVLLKAKSNTSPTQRGKNTPSINPQDRFDEDDDQPLGLRVSRMNPNPSHEEEDDTPLAFHPEQQRRTQFHLFAQQQQHQQQLLMQAQLQSSMMMNASMMSLNPGYYPQPIMNPAAMLQMPAPMPIPSPPPMHDEAKYGRVDRWRRDVVVDRENT